MAGAAGTASCRCGFLLFRLLVGGSRFAALEIGGIPAAAGQLEAGRGNLAGECFLAAFRAGGDIRLADLAHDFLLAAAARALVIVDRHINIPTEK